MPHKTINSFPVIGKEKELPIFMRAVGRNEDQITHDKPEGYMYHQIFFIEEGEVSLTIEETNHLIKNEMGFFIPRDTPYYFRCNSNVCITHWVSFGCECEDTLFPLIDLERYCIFPSLDIKPLKMQFKKMYLLSTQDSFYSRCQNSAMVYSCLMDIYSQQQKYLLSDDIEVENPALLLAKRYIEQYYFNDLTLDTIAEFAHVSPQHLCRLFQKHMHMRPTNYINQTRIKVAKWRLHGTNKTITEIAEEVGYSSPYYFTNTFKKYENMSPSAYRKMVQS